MRIPPVSLSLAPLLAAWAAAPAAAGPAKWGVPPAGWGDFRFALVDDNTQQGILRAALADGVRLYGRYRYLNAGVDTGSNWYGYAGPGGAALLQFEKSSADLGVRGSYVIYMLQEDAGYDAFSARLKDPAFMKAFFWNLEWIAKTLAGKAPVLVVEPDTWGYLLQHEHMRLGVKDPAAFGKASAALPARVGDLGPAHLAGLPNTAAGMVQGIVKTFRTFAPDARIGLHLNTWAWFPPAGGDARGLPWWPQAAVDQSADINAAFLKNLFGGAADLGDFVVVEKYGLDAGYIKSMDASPMGSRYYWGDPEMRKWIGWSKRLAQALDLPLLGWQIPIGNMGLPNTANRWQDTFMEYFFAHPADFVAAGFIGLWVGKGLPQGTDYANGPGKGDDGALFRGLKAFDAKRPWLANASLRRATAAGAALPAARRGRAGMEYRPGSRPPRSAWRDAGGRRTLPTQGISR